MKIVAPHKPCADCGVRKRYYQSYCQECNTKRRRVYKAASWKRVMAAQGGGKRGPHFGDPLAFELTPREIEKFWSFVDKSGECWVWTSYLRNGAGSFYTHGKERIAHRIAWKLAGRELVPGLVLDHICKNRKCVRIDHLRQTTQYFNTVVNSKSVYARNAAKTKCKHGHPFDGWKEVEKHGVVYRTRVCLTCYPGHRRALEAFRAKHGDVPVNVTN